MAMLSETSEKQMREAPVFLGRGLDLLKYSDSFAEIGAVIHSDFVDVTDQDMDALGLRKLEKTRMTKAIQGLAALKLARERKLQEAVECESTHGFLDAINLLRHEGGLSELGASLPIHFRDV